MLGDEFCLIMMKMQRKPFLIYLSGVELAPLDLLDMAAVKARLTAIGQKFEVQGTQFW